MEVELRKVKVTKSVVSQLSMAVSYDMVPENVLGWYFTGKGFTHILIYDQKTKSPYKYILNFTTKIIAEHILLVKVKGFEQFRYQCQSSDHALRLEANLNACVARAKELGQIFL